MTESLVEIEMTIRGGSIPDDHHYLLHSAVKRQCCRRLTARGWQLRTIQGGDNRGGVRVLENTEATLQARVPTDDLDDFLAIQDAPLRLGDHVVLVDEPTVREPDPHTSLVSDCVYGGKRGDADLGAYIGKALGARFGHRDFGIAMKGRVGFEAAGAKTWGWEVHVLGLNDDESLWLQREGLGQKNSWGCGTFWRLPPK